MSEETRASWFSLGAFIGLFLGIGWSAYHGLEMRGAAMRRLRRKHPGWFRSDIEYPPYEEDSMPDFSNIELEAE